MKTNFLLVFWYFLSFTLRNNRLSGYSIPDAVYEYCPYSDICNKSASRRAEEIGQGMVPCCGSCACDDDCGQRLDCCFDEIDKYKLVQNQIVACIAPVIGRAVDVNVDTSYCMVQACYKYSNGDPVNKSCTINDDFGNSLVAPVSSLETGRIYINADCARCNYVTEFTSWGLLYMPGAKTTGFLVTSKITNVRNGEGSAVFVPPSNEDWSRLRCNEDMKTPCEKLDLKEMCENLNLPFISLRGFSYENVFCFICTHKSIESTLSSLPHQCVSKSRTFSAKTMTLLIDASLLDMLSFTRSDSGDLTETGACLQLNDTCLQIHCPQGMLMTSKTCKYFIERWYTPFLVIQVYLEEYHVTKMVGSIFISSRNVTLGDNEYSENSDGNNSTYAVCIDDLDPSYNTGTTDNRQRMSVQMSLALIANILLFN